MPVPDHPHTGRLRHVRGAVTMPARDALVTVDDPVDTSLLEGFVGYAARRASLALIDSFSRRMATLDLRPVTFTLLALVGSNPGITSAQVCATLDIQSSNLVGLVKQLQDRALITRQPHPRDGRAMGLHLSAAGRSLLKNALECAAQAEQDVTARLSRDEVEQLLKLLRKVYA